MKKNLDLVFLVSGNGGNLKFIYSCLTHKFIDGINLVVIADRDCGSLDFAQKKGIENYLIKYSRKDNSELNCLLQKISPDLIITNIHKILDSEIVAKYRGKLVNLHYSLLPAYAGLIGDEPINKAMGYSMFLGTTLHFVEEKVDSGKIIIQGIIKNSGSELEIKNKIFRMGCLMILHHLISLLNNFSILQEDASIQDSYLFSPDLNFNYHLFTRNFWDELRYA